MTIDSIFSILAVFFSLLSLSVFIWLKIFQLIFYSKFLKILQLNSFFHDLFNDIYIMLSLSKTFHWHTMFRVIVSGFLCYFNGNVSVDLFEIKSSDMAFQDLFNGILNFSVAHIFVDLSIRTCRGKIKKVYF